MTAAISTLEGMWELLGDVGDQVYGRDFDEDYVVMAWENTLNLMYEIETRIRFEDQLLLEDY